MDAADWDARYTATAELEWGAEPNRWVAAELADLPPGRACDLGAGEGRNALWLASRGWEVTAVDFSGAALDKGRPLAEARSLPVSWVRADVRRYAVEARAYDAVVLAYLHLSGAERRTVVRAAAEGLAPAGVLIVVGHDTTNVAEGVGGPQDTAVLFTPEDVVADLAALPGLAVERAERVRRTVQRDEGPREAIDALVRVRRTPTPK
ncbi:MAG TPA: class I SAM-dependent methyltransferase [Mycobacteriales bacterium]|nr:class I SAM-dependent methyltransferase [Mycobacteriales bacterium]